MVLLQRGTTWLLGGSMLEKMKIHPYAGIQPKAGLYIVYIMPYILYTLYSLLLTVGVVAVVAVGLSVQTRPHYR